LSALKASRPSNAIMIGDMPPPLELVLAGAGVRAPRGPFCMPLRTSISPMFASVFARNVICRENGR
jgi:hypothetical protein